MILSWNHVICQLCLNFKKQKGWKSWRTISAEKLSYLKWLDNKKKNRHKYSHTLTAHGFLNGFYQTF